MTENILVSNDEAGKRIDIFLFEKYPSYSRTYFKNLILKKFVSVNSKSVKPSHILNKNEKISLKLIEDQPITNLEPENIPLDIIFENDDVIVINKQAGLVVHPAAGNKTGTLVNALINYCPKIKESDVEQSQYSSMRPGIVHRLDKETSGLMVIAKNSRALRSLSKQIKNRIVEKKYLALCFDWPKEKSGIISNYLGRDPKNRKKMAILDERRGKEAISEFKVRNYYKTKNGDKISLIEFNIKTGRTHQIRVHSKLIQIPILGDFVYGTKESQNLSKILRVKRQLLHSYYLSFYLPGDTKRTINKTETPSDFTIITNRLIRE